MSGNAGTFYGVGVGPGDPELMTVKALNVLKGCPVIAVPRSSDSSSDGLSQAFSIIKKTVDLDGKKVMELLFPMTKDREALRASRERAASMVAEELKKGNDVAFITLGDPMLYSTFSYLVPFITGILPGAKVRVIPGVTSFSAAVSEAVIPLAESNERVIIIPAAYDIEEVKEAFGTFETVVLMKVNNIFDRLIDLLTDIGLADKAVFVSRVGWPEQEIVRDIKSLKGRKLDYFSMVIVKKGF